jgi:predicted small metal-binding protein
MAKVIRCRSVGVDCDFEARGETVEEVLQKCAEHGRREHGMTELSPESAAKFRAAIQDEPAAQKRAGGSLSWGSE